jgi:glycerol-3-phosphate acyltransferase PlsY
MNTPQIVGTVFITIGFVLIGYLLGSIVFGPLLTRKYHKDIRTIASGNPGATNVMRAAGKGMGILTMLLDASKGYVAIAISFLIYHFTINQ